MSTSVSVMRPGDTMKRFFREHFFRISTLRYVKSIVIFYTVVSTYTICMVVEMNGLAASLMKYLSKLKMLHYAGSVIS